MFRVKCNHVCLLRSDKNNDGYKICCFFFFFFLFSFFFALNPSIEIMDK